MNTSTNTERPKLKLNFGARPLTLNTNANPAVIGPAVIGPALKKVTVFEKPKSDDIAATKIGKAGSDVTKDSTKSKTVKKSKKHETEASSKKAVNQKVVATPEEILKAKIKRRKKEYFTILTKLQADYPEVFSIDPKPLAIGIHLELKKILNGEFANAQLSRFFHRYCGSFNYKEKLVEGAQRFNLDGSPATLVTKTEIPVLIKRHKQNV